MNNRLILGVPTIGRPVQRVCDLCGSQTSLHMVIQKKGDSEKDIIRICPGCMVRHGLSANSAVLNLAVLQPHRGIRWGRKRGRKR